MIKIKPTSPTSDDNVEFEITVSGCGLDKTSNTVIGSQFIFTVDYVPVPCVLYPPAEFSWPVGKLKAGEYQFILKTTYNEPVTEAFTVSPGELPYPAVPVPSIGTPAAILLAAVLAWLANKALKRTPKSTA